MRTATHTASDASTTTTTAGRSNGGQGGHHLTIPAVVLAVLTSGDPAKTCGANYVTERYLNTAYGGKRGCVNAQAPGSAAHSLKFNDVITSSQPGEATATAVPKGGLYNGEKLTISLVQESGAWKVDGIESNAPVGP